MPLDSLPKYPGEIETAVRGLGRAYVERYEEEILARDRANLRIRIRFGNGRMLEISEASIVESGHIERLGYRYHFQNDQNELIFRYDNTPHFAGLENFPHQKHLPEKVVGSEAPYIISVLKEAKNLAK
jgi:hypothetical protein